MQFLLSYKKKKTSLKFSETDINMNSRIYCIEKENLLHILFIVIGVIPKFSIITEGCNNEVLSDNNIFIIKLYRYINRILKRLRYRASIQGFWGVGFAFDVCCVRT